MKPYEITEGDVVISDDKTRLDISTIHAFLSGRSYWAKGVPIEIVERSIRNSLCFGMFKAGRQIGFARVVTDFSTFAWLADVFIMEEVRGGDCCAPGTPGASALHAGNTGRPQSLPTIRLRAAGISRTFYGIPAGKQLQMI
jgi:hypothetical protein